MVWYYQCSILFENSIVNIPYLLKLWGVLSFFVASETCFYIFRTDFASIEFVSLAVEKGCNGPLCGWTGWSKRERAKAANPRFQSRENPFPRFRPIFGRTLAHSLFKTQATTDSPRPYSAEDEEGDDDIEEVPNKRMRRPSNAELMSRVATQQKTSSLSFPLFLAPRPLFEPYHTQTQKQKWWNIQKNISKPYGIP